VQRKLVSISGLFVLVDTCVFTGSGLLQEHHDSPKDIVWKRNDPNVLFSCSKTGQLIMHHMKNAARPADNCKTSGLSFGSCGFVAHASHVTNSTPRAQSPTGLPTKLTGIFGGWKAGGGDVDFSPYSGPMAASASLDKMINFLNAQSKLNLNCFVIRTPQPCSDINDNLNPVSTVVEHLDAKQFVFAAKHYILDGESATIPFKDLCEHNSEVALEAGFCNAARTWLLLSVFFGNDILLKAESEATGKSKVSLEANDKPSKKLDCDAKRQSITLKTVSCIYIPSDIGNFWLLLVEAETGP